ncbi:hypothetical protein GGS20DRAFT_333844 [Poronia punctata]|nr:hypothetical protein GGS20DRAFT_333844 [Poronia punctata]
MLGRRTELYADLLREAAKIDTMTGSKAEKAETRERVAAAIGLVTTMDEDMLNSLEVEDVFEFLKIHGQVAMVLLRRWAGRNTMQSSVNRINDVNAAQREVVSIYPRSVATFNCR